MSLMGNAPAPVALDFVAKRRRPGWLGWMLLLVGLVAAGAEAVALHGARTELVEREDAVERLRAAVRASRSEDGAAVSRQPPVALEPALKLAAELDAPWGRAFAAVADARHDGLGLLELHGDASRRTLRLVGQARSLALAFEYVESLQSNGALREVRMEGHEWALAGDVPVVRFTASAHWGPSR